MASMFCDFFALPGGEVLGPLGSVLIVLRQVPDSHTCVHAHVGGVGKKIADTVILFTFRFSVFLPTSLT